MAVMHIVPVQRVRSVEVSLPMRICVECPNCESLHWGKITPIQDKNLLFTYSCNKCSTNHAVSPKAYSASGVITLKWNLKA